MNRSAGNSKNYSRDRIPIAIAGCLTMLFLGLIYAWSIFVEPIEAECGWDRSQTSLAFTVSMLCMYSGMAVDSYVSKRTSARFSLVLSAALIFAGFFICSRTSNLYIFCFGYGVLVGLGIGLAYNSWQTVVISWFPDNIGFAAGLIKMAYGFGAFALGSFATMLLHAEALGGWRHTFIILGAALGLCILLAQFVHKAPPHEFIERAAKPSKARSGLNLGPKEAFPTATFLVFWLWKLAVVGAGTSVIGQAAMIASDAGASDAIMALISVGVLSIGNGIGRIVNGALFDRLGLHKTMYFISGSIFGFSTLLAVSYANGWPVPVLIGLCGLGFTYGGGITLGSCFINSVFGLEHYKANASVNGLTSSPITLIATTAIAAIKTGTGSYLGFFYIAMAAGVVGLIASFAETKLIPRLRAKHANRTAGAE